MSNRFINQKSNSISKSTERGFQKLPLNFKMMNEEMVEYIKEELAKGLSEEEIKENMKWEGWEDEDIERLMRRAKAGTL